MVVHRTEQIPDGATKASSPDAIKALYRRPVTIPFPASNPYSPAKAVLGKKLFFDTRLSAANLHSCATCHNPGFGWSDGQPKAVGHGSAPLLRRSPTVHNLAWGEVFMWDGRAASLEEQALLPIQTEAEMNLSIARMLERLAAIREYRELFAQAFGAPGLSAENVAKALATYERTLVSGWTPFDAWIEGKADALSPAAQRGFELFNGKARCAFCHTGWNFTDDGFHDIGLAGSDVGRGRGFADIVKLQHAFKTPTLRGIAHRAPFMHDGSLPDLRAVVDHYDSAPNERPSRSELIAPLGLSEDEKQDLVAFLASLTSNSPQTTVPHLPATTSALAQARSTGR